MAKYSSKYFVGIIGALIGALAGAWLMIAPVILAYQPQGADWTAPSYTDFWTGLPLTVVSVVGLISYFLGLVEELYDRGIIEPRAAWVYQQPAPQSAAQSGDNSIEQALAPLLAEMLRDMQEQRRSGGAATGYEQQRPQLENQRQVRR